MQIRGRTRGPSPSTVFSVIALVFATSGIAFAANGGVPNEVKSFTATGGPEESNSPGSPVELVLSRDTFTQKAGEVVLISATAEFDIGTSTQCEAEVVVTFADPEQGKLGLFMWEATDLGDYGQYTDSEAVPAPPTTITRTLRAFLVESNEPGRSACDQDPPEGDGNADTYTGAVRISVTRLR